MGLGCAGRRRGTEEVLTTKQNSALEKKKAQRFNNSIGQNFKKK